MKTLKNESLKPVEPKVRSMRGWRTLFALVLVAAFAVLSIAGSAQVGLADKGGTDGHPFTAIHAIYHFYGSEHSFTAHVYVTEDDNVGTAVITGHVTEGWLEDAQVTGAYTVWANCPIATPGNVYGTLCFQGALHIQRGDAQ